jgi:hypothetical protein
MALLRRLMKSSDYGFGMILVLDGKGKLGSFGPAWDDHHVNQLFTEN